ncbi:MAG TPA: carboxypeptidase-like regulatory domain-containing protein, partial [Terriglobales bacterium]|nr:carboxypeptidase-like regulatory domain-containing protein [Terriglobales bacterium]
SAPCMAQTGTTALTGEITDPQGAVVAGAKVSIAAAETGTVRTTETDASGHYQFLSLPPGTYRVSVEKQGFHAVVRDNVELLVSTTQGVDFKLELGAVSQTVQVSEAAPTINTADATVGNPFDEKEVKELPFLARNVVNLLTLQPGVVFTGNSDTDRLSQGDISTLDGREGSVNGVRGNQTNVTLDGADVNDWQNQAAFTSALPVTLDSVQEFRVTTANANSTEGVASGAQVALVTKSGTDSFHGNVRWYYRTSGATANSFFNKLETPPIGRPKLQRNIGGGSLGGPILKDRFFFFLDYEARREASSFSVSPRNVPSDALKDGVLIYACAGGVAACPGQSGTNAVQGLTKTWTTAPGTFGLTPSQFQSIDPAGQGVNPAMVQYMAQLPSGNSPGQGFDGGLAFDGLIFNAPQSTLNNVYTARLDYNLTKDGRHAIYARGVLGGLKSDLIEANFPGEAPTSRLLNNSRGTVVGYTAQLRSNLTNTFHYGFTRLGVAQSGSQSPTFSVRSFTDIENFSRAFGHQLPVNEYKDDLIWTRGKHTVQIGGALRYLRNHRQDETQSFPNYFINNGFCVSLCKDPARSLGTGTPIPAGAAFPQANNTTQVIRAMMMLTGSITQVNTVFQADAHTGSVFPQDTEEFREFAENDYELYGQDSWRLRNNVTLTLGLRYAYSTPPWETHGQQTAVTTDIHQWLVQREINQANGIPSSASPLLSWGLAGRANSKPSWFDPNKKDFAPRMALAWSPAYQGGLLKSIFGGPGKSSIRIGSGIFYDRLGQAMAAETDLQGSPGVFTPIIDGSQQFTFANAPRFSGSCTFAGCTGLPPLSAFFPPITSVQFPFTPPANTSNLGFVIDRHLHTPYTIDLNFSVQRELAKGVVLDVSYVGTLGRRLLAKTDYAQYLNITDTKSKTTLFQAMSQLVKQAGETPGLFNGNANINPFDLSASGVGSIKSIPFFDNMLPNMPAFTAGWYGDSSFSSLTPTQAFYAYAVGSWTPSWSCALFAMDTVATPTSFAFGLPTPWNSTLDPNSSGFVLFTPQFSSLPGWTNFGNSNYHSLQVSVRKSSGPLVYGVNYVYSKGIDNTSGAENQDNVPNGNLTNGTLNGLIQNPFDLRANRAPSDFDLRHNINGFWLVDLPFGKGKKFGATSGYIKDATIGGWEWSGTLRFHTGFPLGPANGFNFPTNFFLTPFGTVTQPISTSLNRCIPVSNPPPACLPNLFSNPTNTLNMIVPTLPGADGSRNVFRGPAYFVTDMGVYKSFRMPWKESQRLQFRVTAFNVFNTVNFSDIFASLDPTSPSTFGQVTATAGPRGGAREMEFAVRFEF